MNKFTLDQLEYEVNRNLSYCLHCMELGSKDHNREFFDAEYEEAISLINSLYHLLLIDYAELSSAKICLAASSIHIWYENNV